MVATTSVTSIVTGMVSSRQRSSWVVAAGLLLDLGGRCWSSCPISPMGRRSNSSSSNSSSRQTGFAILGDSWRGSQSRRSLSTTTRTTSTSGAQLVQLRRPLALAPPTSSHFGPLRLTPSGGFFHQSANERRFFSKMSQMEMRRIRQEQLDRENAKRQQNSQKLSAPEREERAKQKAQEYAKFQEEHQKANQVDEDAGAEQALDEKIKRRRRKKPKHATPLQQHALRRANGPDPHDNPTAVRIREWTQVEGRIAQVERETLAWVRRVVVGLNLCPFAEPFVANEDLFRVRIALESDMTDADTIVDIVIYELEHLIQRQKGTTLVVCPNLYRDNFVGFLQVLDVVEQNLQAQGWEGQVQIAPFHPRFVFAGDNSNDPNAPEHGTNRSPHPIFHLLREDDVSRAVARLPNDGDAAVVWSRNVQVLRQLHKQLTPAEFQTVVSGQEERSSSLRQTVQEVVRQHRIALVTPKTINDNNVESSSSSSSSDDDEEEGAGFESSSDEENEDDSDSNAEVDGNTRAAHKTRTDVDNVDGRNVHRDKDQRNDSS